ncbi:MAG TPA: sigma-54 dependent transcriptional regulator [Alphaproteobacteria bacterium]|nr:sigma-54 dependent transcriptional regulator [Alphaproteobacteria bacterium]
MQGGERVLIVDDEDLMRELVAKILSGERYRLYQASSAEQALKLLQEQPIDLILTDLKLKGMDGLSLLSEARAIDPDIIVIVMTAYASVETAVDAMRKGAYDYITKPFINEEIRVMLRRALDQRHLSRENLHLKRELRERYRFENIVGSSEAMQKVYRLIEKVASISSNVLIFGETGTGKELVARAIHYNSDRAERPFVAVNCGALTESLLESELFGHVKGAFTGATANKEGFFRKADRGTLFLDELNEVSPGLQVKLLRAIQEREVIPVGGREPLKFDVRLIAATNKNLEEAVKNRTFREDLFYRINVITVHLPPLRERKEDLPLLVQHFLAKHGQRLGKPSVKMTRQAMQTLINYGWPGNVRELENMIERTVALCEGDTIDIADLPEKLTQVKIAIRDPEEHELTLDALEEQHIKKVLQKVEGDKVRAAHILGINLSTLYRKLARYQS